MASPSTLGNVAWMQGMSVSSAAERERGAPNESLQKKEAAAQRQGTLSADHESSAPAAGADALESPRHPLVRVGQR